MFQIIFGFFLLGFGVLNIYLGVQDRLDLGKYILKEDVINAFAETKWDTDSFSCGGALLTDKNGNTIFYEAKKIDAAIEKLNQKLRE